MANIWVLVADASRAKVFEATSPIGELDEIASFEHLESREHNHDLTTDLSGRSGHDTMDNGSTAKDHEAGKFAKELCEHLTQQSDENAFDRLVLVAPPAFLGRLRGELNTPLRNKVKVELNKDLTRFGAHAVREHLPYRL